MGKPLWLLLVLTVGTLGPAWGGEPFSIPLYDPVSGRDLPGPGASTPTPTPTVTASQPVPAVTPVPTPVSPGTQPLLRAPDWTEVKTAPGNLHPLGKKSPWMSLLGLGADIPLGTGMARGYAVGFDLDLGTGYRLDDDWSLWANASLGQFSSRDDGLTRHNNFMMIEGAVWAKYRFSRGVWSPYLFAGPGLAYNENRDDRTAQYDPLTGYYDVPINRYEVDLVAEGGLGMDLRAGEAFHLFLQGRFIANLTSPGFGGYASTDSPILLMPVEFGVLFGY